MSKADSVKEEIGFLKIVFTVFVAVDASLVAWIAQKFGKAAVLLLLGAYLSVFVLTIGAIWVTRRLYRRFEELEVL